VAPTLPQDTRETLIAIRLASSRVGISRKTRDQ
jgi:hypothetical protein